MIESHINIEDGEQNVLIANHRNNELKEEKDMDQKDILLFALQDSILRDQITSRNNVISISITKNNIPE